MAFTKLKITANENLLIDYIVFVCLLTVKDQMCHPIQCFVATLLALAKSVWDSTQRTNGSNPGYIFD